MYCDYCVGSERFRVTGAILPIDEGGGLSLHASAMVAPRSGRAQKLSPSFLVAHVENEQLAPDAGEEPPRSSKFRAQQAQSCRLVRKLLEEDSQHCTALIISP